MCQVVACNLGRRLRLYSCVHRAGGHPLNYPTVTLTQKSQQQRAELPAVASDAIGWCLLVLLIEKPR